MPDNNKITKNSFSGGRNTDVNVAQLPPEQYISAHNVDFTANGNFFALQNVISTTNLAQFANDPNIKEIGSAPCKFTITNLGVTTVAYCIIYFTMSSTDGKYRIWMFNTEAQTLHLLYEELYGPGYNTPDRVVDIINYPENGVDHVYFADDYNEIRQLECVYNPPQALLSPYDLSLQRGGANGEIALDSITIGGSLLSGTYQFAYRMCDPTARRFTKWSSITNPVHVYNSDNGLTNQVFSGVGLLTNRQITLTITPSQQEIDALPTLGFIQLAVIENVGSTPATTVSLQPFVDFPNATSISMVYSSNTRIASESLDGFVIDPAQILSAKTLRTTNNRLFAGNINYVDLKFDSPFGLPTVTSGTIVAAADLTVGDSYSSDDFSSRHIGHFRDEVYRYGVVYKDKYGNRSYVSPLDMNNITDNQCAMLSTGGRDMKFPKRSHTGGQYTLFNSSFKMQGLGLSVNVQNHPTWAVSMEVVRVPRMKNILFQTPLVPMSSINGSGVVTDYPSLPSYFTGTETLNHSYPDAQPMVPGIVMVPKNLFWPEGRDIRARTTPDVQNSVFYTRGESYFYNGPDACSYNFSMVFPQPNMYGDTSTVNGIPNTFVYSGSEKIDFVDQFLVRLKPSDNFSTKVATNVPGPYIGEDIDTSIAGNFYAVADGDYFYNANFAGTKTHPNESQNGSPMTGFQFYDNFGVTAPVSGQSIMDYEGLSTKGYQFGYTPNIQRSGVASFKFTTASGYLPDPTHRGGNAPINTQFLSGLFKPYGASGGGFILDNTGAKYQPSNKLTSGYINEPNTTWGYGNTFVPGAVVSALDIVNVISGLQDNRYGELNALHTYQSTGAVHTFSDVEQGELRNGNQVSVPIEIWGGDCFVAAHTFKVCDSTYSITCSAKNWTPLGTGSSNKPTETYRWGYFYMIVGGIEDKKMGSFAVAVKNSAQFLTVVLESEYNGGVRDQDILPAPTTEGGVPLLNCVTVSSCRTPLTYNYNFNLSRGNYQKVFTSLLPFSFQQYSYEARVAYSNIKVYNSDISGFDVFSVADYYDLPEQRYGITSLAVAADMLYALQERGVVYLPTSGRQIEQADSSTLAVTSGDVIGRPVVVSTERGTQHLRAVQEIGNMVFLTDNKNKEFYVLAGTELNLITENQQTEMKRIWNLQFPENSVKGVYNFADQQWLIAMPSGVQVYDHEHGVWIGDYEALPHGGSYQRGIVYMTAFDGNTSNFCVHSMYTAPSVNNLFGNIVDPRVSFAVNPDEAFSKTFDVFMIDSSDKLATADLEVVYDTSSVPNNINGLNLAVPSIENNYRIPLGKDSNGYRLRGMRMLVTAHWGSLQAQLKSIYTKYRYSKRTPF